MTYVKCTDCGLLKQKIGSFKEMGMLNGQDCPNCGGELVLLNDDLKEEK
jgi:predicted  nucleic acid-binding Zn-ribbon protein